MLPCIRKTGDITDGANILLPCIRKTSEITDGACILLPCIRKTGQITDGACILLHCIRKTGEITDGANKIDVRTPNSARSRRASPSGIAREPASSRRRSFIPPAVLRWCHLHHKSYATAPASEIPYDTTSATSPVTAPSSIIPHSSTCIFFRRPVTSLVSAKSPPTGRP